MKKYLLLLGWCILACRATFAQDVTFSFANPQNTNDGTNDYYEVDVMISTSTPFKLGSGQLYLNYNSAAFGQNVIATAHAEITHPAGYVLGQKDNWLGLVDVYGDFVVNDNTDSRFSFFWLQSKEGDCIDINVPAAPTPLFHVKIQYDNVSESPGVCFEASGIFDDQTFTHCGPNDGTCALGDEDCISDPGTQILNDNFDCAGAALLPLDLLSFQASHKNENDALLQWETASEYNTSHFEIQRSANGMDWQVIGEHPAASFSETYLNYLFLDKGVHASDAPSATFYYRLRMVDLDGTFTFSPVRSVSFDGKDGLSIFPNPTYWGVNIQTERLEEEELNVQMFSVDGKLLLKETIAKGFGKIAFPASVKPGVYQLKISSKTGHVWSERVVKF